MLEKTETLRIWYRLQEIFAEAAEDPHSASILIEAMSWEGFGHEPGDLLRQMDHCDPQKAVEYFFDSNPSVTPENFETIEPGELAADLLCLFERRRF